jgi:hypothetical protein
VHFASNHSGAGATAAMPIVGNFLHKSFNDRSLQMKQDEFPLPSDSTSAPVNFDCAAVRDSLKKEERTSP